MTAKQRLNDFGEVADEAKILEGNIQLLLKGFLGEKQKLEKSITILLQAQQHMDRGDYVSAQGDMRQLNEVYNNTIQVQRHEAMQEKTV